MHPILLWLLPVLGAAIAIWRLVHARRQARTARAARELAQAVALAEAQKAARRATEAGQARVADAQAALRQKIVDNTAARASAADRNETRADDRADTAEAARRQAQRTQKAQQVARVEAKRRTGQAADPQEAPRPATAAPAPDQPPAARVPAAPSVPAATGAAADTIPAPPPPAAAPAPTPAAPPAPAFKTAAQTVILLADDSKMVRVKTSRLLAGHEFQVVTAIDGLDAVRQLETVLPDLVITDVDMPGLDGFGLTRHLRGDARTAHIPIVMITSAEDRHRDAALAAGVGLVLGKPYPEDELLAWIRGFRFASTPATLPA